MNKNITRQEKLEFYKQYNSEEFQKRFKNCDKIYRILFFSSLPALTIASIILGCFNPWLFFCLVPALTVPFGFSALETSKRNKLIKEINKNFNDSDIYEMIESGEWSELAKEISEFQIKTNHKKPNEEKIADVKKIKNNNRSLNVCIIDEKDAKTQPKEKNLLRLTTKRNKNKKVEAFPKAIQKTSAKESIKITYSILSKFAESLQFSLLEFTPMQEEINTNYVKLKTRTGKIMEFEVSSSYFIGLYKYEDVDLTAEWRNYLSNTSTKNV